MGTITTVMRRNSPCADSDRRGSQNIPVDITSRYASRLRPYPASRTPRRLPLAGTLWPERPERLISEAMRGLRHSSGGPDIDLIGIRSLEALVLAPSQFFCPSAPVLSDLKVVNRALDMEFELSFELVVWPAPCDKTDFGDGADEQFDLSFPWHETTPFDCGVLLGIGSVDLVGR